MAAKRKKVKHELENLKPTLDLIYQLDNATCWLCGEFVHRRHASIDHAVPKKYLGSIRAEKVFCNFYLAHKRCNQLRGSPVPLPNVIRWDRMPEKEHKFAREMVRRMEYWWADILPKDVMRFVYDHSSVVPVTEVKWEAYYVEEDEDDGQ